MYNRPKNILWGHDDDGYNLFWPPPVASSARHNYLLFSCVIRLLSDYAPFLIIYNWNRNTISAPDSWRYRWSPVITRGIRVHPARYLSRSRFAWWLSGDFRADRPRHRRRSLCAFCRARYQINYNNWWATNVLIRRTVIFVAKRGQNIITEEKSSRTTMELSRSPYDFGDLRTCWTVLSF